MRTRIETARHYLKRGWQPLPIPYGSKKPCINGWQNLTLTELDLPSHFNGKPQNIGILLGAKSKGLTDIDLDSREAVLLADFFLPKTEAVFGRKSKPRSHRLYYCADTKFEKFNTPFLISSEDEAERKTTCIVEIRTGNGMQTVFPPSMHEAGEPIEWQTEGEPAEASAKDLRRAVGLLASACLISKFWRKGAQHDLALALSGGLLRNGFKVKEVEKFIYAVCFAVRDTESSDRMRAVKTTAKALKETKPLCIRNAEIFAGLKVLIKDKGIVIFV